MSWTKVASFVAHETREYSFELDEYRDGDDKQMLFVHLYVTHWSPGTLREMLDVFAKFREVVSCPLYALGITDDEKWAKFVALFGFEFLRDVICENGEQRRLFLNIKKDKNNGKFNAEDGKPVFAD